MEVTLKDGHIVELAHDTRGCILTQASAAILGRISPGMGPLDLKGLETAVCAMLKDNAPPPLPDYTAFEGATAVPSRHTCVLLPLKALRDALEPGLK
jgi:nitrogen fixation NifU-like protein